MLTQNYSKLNNREKKLYSIQDLAISKTGIDFKFLIICGVLVGISVILSIIFAIITGIWYFNPIKDNGDIDAWGLMIMLGIPIGIASALYFMRIQQYRLIDFLTIYFKPKQTLSLSGKKVVHTKVKVDAFMEVQGELRH